MMFIRICVCLVLLFLHMSRIVKGAAPTCSSVITKSVASSEPVGFIVADKLCTDSDTGDTLTYSIISGNTDNQFNVDSNGLLKVAKTFSVNYKFTLVIQALDTTAASATQNVVVDVTSSNDYDPVVTWPAINVKDSAPIGTLLGTCTVTDQDSTKETLAGQTRVNFLKPTIQAANKWVLDSHSCELYLNQELNYDVKRNYALKMVAYDLDPTSARTVTHQAVINVLNAQENQPTCTEFAKVVPMLKRAVVGTDITVVSCSDVDQGLSGQLTYDLADSNSANSLYLFHMDATSGLLSLKSPILNDTIPFYEVLIHVKDGATPSLFTNALVRVVITDVPQDVVTLPSRFNKVFLQSFATKLPPIDSRNAPPLPTPDVNGLPYCSRYAVTAGVSESIGVDENVYDLGCRDPDGDNLIYNIYRGNVFDKFKMEGGTLKTRKTLNADARNNYHLRIAVSDTSSMQLSTTVTVAVRVTNINDNQPIINTNNNFISVSEGKGYGQNVHNFQVTDKDPSSELAGQIRIGWANPDDPLSKQWFLDSVNRNLYVNSELDYETTPSYTLVLLAWDLDEYSPLTATATITISITPETESPECPKLYTTTLPQVPNAGEVLTTILCTDTDTIPASQVHYELGASNTDKATATFAVGDTNGQLTLLSGVVYDNQISHELIIFAYDAGSPTLSSTVTVQVIKGTAPMCGGDISKSVASSEPVGFTVADLQCTDSDAGDTLTYSIISGNTDNQFNVDSNGLLGVAKTFGAVAVFVMEIEVMDSTNAKTHILVKITTNSASPVITGIPDTLYVSEATTNGSVIKTCRVTDQDKYSGSLAGYTEVGFQNPDDRVYNEWYLDSSTCSLYVNGDLDYETTPSYTLFIMAWDLDPFSPRTTTTTVTVIIQDIFENKPPVCPPLYTTYMLLSAPLGSMVTQVACTDSDPNQYGKVYYSLDNSNDGLVLGTFGVQAITGELLVQAALVHKITHTVKIIASDGGSPDLSSTTTVMVTVDDTIPTTPAPTTTPRSTGNVSRSSTTITFLLLLFLTHFVNY